MQDRQRGRALDASVVQRLQARPGVLSWPQSCRAELHQYTSTACKRTHPAGATNVQALMCNRRCTVAPCGDHTCGSVAQGACQI